MLFDRRDLQLFFVRLNLCGEGNGSEGCLGWHLLCSVRWGVVARVQIKRWLFGSMQRFRGFGIRKWFEESREGEEANVTIDDRRLAEGQVISRPRNDRYPPVKCSSFSVCLRSING